MNRNEAVAGHFYAVGVGPGDPGLLTIRAARLIESADVVLAPQSKSSAHSLALQAAQDFISDQDVLIHKYPMTRENSKTRRRWRELAEEVAGLCAAGKSVVQLTLGDPLIYATSSYLLEALASLMPADTLHLTPGISAFQMVASRFGKPLTLQEDRLLIMSAADLEAVEQAFARCETLVLFKAASALPELIELLERYKLLHCASLVSSGGQGERELAVADLSNWARQELGYMTTMIIHLGQRSWQEREAS